MGTVPREALAKKRERAIEIANRMNAHYGMAECALHWWKDPFKLTIAVSLSAQTTDKSVNEVTPTLWKHYPSAYELAAARLSDVERILKSIGLYRNKSKNCIACAQMIMSDFNGEVPHTMDELTKLPGVGRKTANIVLNEAFGIVEGIAVDTHVFRIAHKLQLARSDAPLKTEQELLKLYPQSYWKPINHQWVLFGRETCIARHPRCSECFLSDLCPSAHVE